MATTRIGNRDVPLIDAPKAIVTFTAGKGGADEVGAWEFWTAMQPITNGWVKNTARCRVGADPGERFRRMEGTKGYESGWTIASNAQHLRPTTRADLEGWLNSHRGDARFAQSADVEGKLMRVVEKDGRYRLAL